MASIDNQEYYIVREGTYPHLPMGLIKMRLAPSVIDHGQVNLRRVISNRTSRPDEILYERLTLYLALWVARQGEKFLCLHAPANVTLEMLREVSAFR